LTDTIQGLKSEEAFDRDGEAILALSLNVQPCDKWKVYRLGRIGGAKMEEGVTIAKVPAWMVLKPEMMRHLIREHEKVGRTLTEEETVTLLRSLGFEISEAK
jgi:hypothetical protein